MDWATRAHGVRRFVLSISPANEPSLRLARKFGFRKVGSVTDPEDGVEDVFLLDVNASQTAGA
jgi:RimJ/RimL family protein N-acetyltransferase